MDTFKMKARSAAALAAIVALGVGISFQLYSFTVSTAPHYFFPTEVDYDLDDRRQLEEISRLKLDEIIERQRNVIRERHSQSLLRRGMKEGSPEFERALKYRLDRRDRRVGKQRTVLELEGNEEIWTRGKFRSLRPGGPTYSNENGKNDEILEAEMVAQEFQLNQNLNKDNTPFRICDRGTRVDSKSDLLAVLQPDLPAEQRTCPEFTKDKPVLMIDESVRYGRTGNRLVSLLHAVQQARDEDLQIGISTRCWATTLLSDMWFASHDELGWKELVEKTLCVKLFDNDPMTEGYEVIHTDGKELFWYTSPARLADYMTLQQSVYRSLWVNYNTGEGSGVHGSTRDMCSGIDALFSPTGRADAVYSVIHSRYLEGEPGRRLLGAIARKSGCDKTAALTLDPIYVKGILEPLGMLNYPIVVIHDGENERVINRLKEDPDLGPMIRLVPAEASWIGGDITLGVMADVFIGNPASTFSTFIARTRLSLGKGHSELFKQRDGNGGWRTVCGDHCVFDQTVMGKMS